MTEVPKIVHHRLLAAERGRPKEESHPEADVLNAFAEQALAETEREGVLAHLTRCLDCREVLATALAEVAVPEAEVVPVPEVGVVPARVRKALVRETLARKILPARFGWMGLRWPALAAGIAVAVLVARPGLERLSRWENDRPGVASSTATSSQPVPTAAVAQPATGAQVSSEEAKVASASGDSGTALTAREQASAGIGKSAKSDKMERLRSPSPSRHPDAQIAESSSLVADARIVASGGQPTANNPAGPIVRAKPAPGAVSGQSVQNQIAQNQASGAAAAVLMESPQWMVEGGALKRSLDGGRNWESVLQPENSLLCYASRGGQMWAGGKAGTLLHSTDGGGTWVPVSVMIDGKVVDSDIKNISMRDLGAVSLTTANNEVFTSLDNGKSWEKK